MLVDASNHFHRAFNMPGTDLRAPDGFPTTGLHGFFQIMASVEKKISPDYIFLIFDKGKSFRNKIFADYKGNRKPKSDDFIVQWNEIKALCTQAGYPVYAKDDGYEADDVIGTLAIRYQSDVDVVIFSGDKDFAQLVNDDITLLSPCIPAGLKTYNREATERKYKVKAEQILDVFALVGDKSDNVPGIDGVGLVTAAKYVGKYGSCENVLENADDIGGKRGLKVKESVETVRNAYRLIKISTDVPLECSLSDLVKGQPKNEPFYQSCVRYGLKVLIKNFQLQSPY